MRDAMRLKVTSRLKIEDTNKEKSANFNKNQLQSGKRVLPQKAQQAKTKQTEQKNYLVSS